MSIQPDRRSLLRHQGSDVSDMSTTGIATPTSSVSPQQRHGFRREATNEAVELLPSLLDDKLEVSPLNSPTPSPRARGLGITDPSNRISIARVPVGTKRVSQTSSPSDSFIPTGAIPVPAASPEISQSGTPGSQRLLLSPEWKVQESKDHTYRCGNQGNEQASHDPTDSRGHSRQTSYGSAPAEPYMPDEDTTKIRHATSYATTGVPRSLGCPTNHDLHSGRGSYLSMTLLALSIYSTMMSLIWLITALIQPRWGRKIYSGGGLSPSTASLLSALFSKTIELSFVTVFVGFLGQVLSRRSIAKWSSGMTISEMSMRTWVIQPGYLLTNWKTLRYTGLSILSVLSFVAALAAMLYTTASDALVAPKLKQGDWMDTTLYGLVQTSYANPNFVTDSCETPISFTADTDKGSTCLSIKYSGQSFYNYMAWMDKWTRITVNGTGESTDIVNRPQAVAQLYDNTTVQGSWVMANSSNMTSAFEKYNRIVQNVTMAMPHAGLFAAARDSKNNIMQPQELDGVGGYSIKAAIVSPSVNVMCVNMAFNELAPLVYTEWPNAKITTNPDNSDQKMPVSMETWMSAIPSYDDPQHGWLNATVVDDIFGWGEKYNRHPPIFPLFPATFNSVMNSTIYSSDSVYVMLKSQGTNYTVCSMRSFLYPNCSTQLEVSGTAGGSSLISNCEDPTDRQAYALSVPNSPITLSKDWANLAVLWGLATSLNDGSLNANSANARLLSQLAPQVPSFPSLEPSLAEALAVLVGSTLLLSTTSATFYHFWGYQSTTLNPGEYENFNASITTQQYASGYSQRWQAAFYPILLIVAVINPFCLVYFILRSGLVTDYTEPQNLFALALNSPPSETLAGSCGAGPKKTQFLVDWYIRMEEDTEHYYIIEGDAWKHKKGARDLRRGYEMEMSNPNQSSPSFKDSQHSRASSYPKLYNTRSLL